MTSEPRKATDVLLDVESKIDVLIGIVRSQDLVIKVLSNKLNDVIGRLDKQQAGPPKIVVEAVQTQAPLQSSAVPPGFTQIPAGEPERTIPVLAESKMPQTDAPQGFRRNSRPETYAGDGAYLTRPPEPKMPVQLPKMPPPGTQTPPGRQAAMTPPPGRTAPPVEDATPQASPHSTQNQIPVQQRCVDKNGKSFFLADVQITDLSNGQPVFKTRTNGTGKWMAALGIGGYRVVISKRASQNKEKFEAVQDIQVDGTQSPLELPMMIIK